MDIRMHKVFGWHPRHTGHDRRGGERRQAQSGMEPYLSAAALTVLILALVIALWTAAYYLTGYVMELFS